jgi:hypothetical protein
MVEDISPRDTFERVLRCWWVIALVMVAGGLIGWGISRFSSPVYEARAGYQVTLDDDMLLAELQKTNPEAELTYDIRAPYLAPAALVFFSPEVRAAVKDQAVAAGLDFPRDGFETRQLSLDQRGSDWMIVVRDSSRDTAAKLANLWVEVADQQLRRAHEQAVLAAAIKIQIDLLAKCFTDSSLTDANQCAGTSFASATEMQTDYQNLDRQYQDALSASEGISPLVSFTPGMVAVPPARPVYYNTGLLMLVGSLLGLIIGGLLVQRMPLKKG